MATSIRVPDPVYDRIVDIATAEDITQGAVVREWMLKAQRLDNRDSTSTPDDNGPESPAL